MREIQVDMAIIGAGTAGLDAGDKGCGGNETCQG
jgi:hypothetical protein